MRKSSLPTSPISTTSNSPSSGCASGASFIPPPCQTPFATITSCIRPRRSVVVEPHRHLGVLPLEEHAGQRVEERRLPAERLRHPVRALGDGAAHADRADVREPALGVLAAPGAEATRPASIVRGRPSRATRTASSNARRDAVGADEVHARSRAGSSRARRRDAGDPVHDLVQRAVAADRDDERGAVRRRLRRASSIRWPGPLREQRLARRGRAAPRGGRAPASACPWRRRPTPG